MAAFNFHRRKTRRWWYVGATLVAAAFFTVFFVVGAGAVTGTPSGFESADGNVILNDTSSGNSTDWACFVGQPGFQSGTPNAKCKVTTGATQLTADSTSAGELEIKPGSKFDDACFQIQGGNNPPKDEWSNIAEYTEAAGNGDIYFYGASIRPVVNGNSSGNVYFSQTKDGCHTTGDVLLAFDFLNGGGTPALHSLQWLGSGSNLSCYISNNSPPCWGNLQTISTANYDGNVNGTGTLNDTAISGNTLPANAFAEFGINLTQAVKAALGTAPPCFASQTWVSRSSGSSFSSNPEDVEVVNRPTCGSITIIKHTLNGSGTRSPAVDKSFSYTTTGPGALNNDSFSLNDKDGSDTVTGGGVDTNNTKVYSNVSAGSYTVTEGAEPANFAFVSLACTSSGTGTSTTPGSAGSTSVVTATITLGVSGNVVCTYTNQQQLGSIKITKNSTKSATTLLSGASFYICTNNVNSTSTCTAPTGVTNPVTTGSDGTVCTANLPLAQYYVFESAAPAGYAIGSTANQSANLTSNGDCSTGGTVSKSLTFTDPPTFSVKLLEKDDGSGATHLDTTANPNFTCTVSAGGGTSSTTATSGWDNSYAINGIKAGSTAVTVTCTAVVDP